MFFFLESAMQCLDVGKSSSKENIAFITSRILWWYKSMWRKNVKNRKKRKKGKEYFVHFIVEVPSLNCTFVFFFLSLPLSPSYIIQFSLFLRTSLPFLLPSIISSLTSPFSFLPSSFPSSFPPLFHYFSPFLLTLYPTSLPTPFTLPISLYSSIF